MENTDITSRARMIAAIEGSEVDRIPIAPLFWGGEYTCKLMNRPIWEIIHGPAEILIDRLVTLNARHNCDWLLVMHPGTGRMAGKRQIAEDKDRVYFLDADTGEKWAFDRKLQKLAPVNPPSTSYPKMPRNREEASAILNAPSSPSIFPIIAPSLGIRDHFPSQFLCGAIEPPFSEIANRLGFRGRAQLMNDDPSLCAWMAEQTMGDTEALAKRYAADGLDGAILVDWWEPANLAFYRDWIAPLHRRIAKSLHAVGLKSIFLPASL